MEQEQMELDGLWGTLCEAVPEESIRCFFQKHIKTLQAAYAGRRMPKFSAISEQELRDALHKQQKNGEARIFLTGILRTWKVEYETARDAAKTAGCTTQLAVVKGILGSSFRLHPELVFDLYKSSTAKAARQAILELVGEVMRPTASEAAANALREREKAVALEERKLRVAKHAQEEDLAEAAKKSREEQEARHLAQEAEERSLAARCAELQKDIETAKQALAAIRTETDAWQEARQTVRDDVQPVLDDAFASSGGGMLSLMMPDMSRPGEQHILRRIADVDWTQGCAALYTRNPSEPFYEHNATIVGKHVELAAGCCTLVNWQAVPNKNMPERPYYHAVACNVPYIEVVVLQDCRNLEDVAGKLKEGVTLCDSNCRWALTYPSSDEQQEALLLFRDAFVRESGAWTVSPDFWDSPVFLVERKRFLPFADGTRCMYQKLSLGKPVRTLYLKPRNEIIRQCVIEAASRKKLALTGLATKEWQRLRDALQTVATEDLYARVAQACRWPRKEAEQAVRMFLQSVDADVLCTDADSEALCMLARRNRTIIAQCKDALRDEWSREHAEACAKGEAEERRLKEEAAQAAAAAEKIRAQRDEIAADYERMQAELKNKRSIVADVEKRVRAELAKLQGDTAGEIARWMVAHPMLGQLTAPAKLPREAAQPLLMRDAAEFCKRKLTLNPTDEKNRAEDAEGLYWLLWNNLEKAGVTEKRISEAFAGLAYACAVHAFPLILAGASSIGISDAIACSLYGEMPLLVDLPRTYSPAVLQQLERHPEKSIIFENVFASEWINHIDRLARMKRPVFFVAPFADDLEILPKGASSYGFPVLTDLLIDKPEPDGVAFSGDKGQELYQEEAIGNAVRGMRFPYLRGLHMMPFELARYQEILAIMHGFADTTEQDVLDALLCGVPYAYLHSELASYWKHLKEKELSSSSDAPYVKRIEAFFGEEVAQRA